MRHCRDVGMSIVQYPRLDELLMNGHCGTIAFQASDISAFASSAVDVDADVSDFRCGAPVSVDEPFMVHDSQADPFSDEIVRYTVG
jgi:hypothetical protein